MGRLKGILFDLGDTLIVELDQPADVRTSDFEVLEGVEETLTRLKQRFKLVIVSNTLSWGDAEVELALNRKDLAKFFDAIITSVDANSRKPDPGIFLKALSIIGCKPEEVIMVGDRTDTDIAGANRVGVTTVLCRWNNRYPLTLGDDESFPDFIIGSIGELPELIAWLDAQST